MARKLKTATPTPPSTTTFNRAHFELFEALVTAELSTPLAKVNPNYERSLYQVRELLENISAAASGASTDAVTVLS